MSDKTTLGAGMSDEEQQRIDKECNPRTLPGMSDNQKFTSQTTDEDQALWRSLGRLARIYGKPCQAPSSLPSLNEAWTDGWWQQDKVELQNEQS
jgi:hypothetical protein